MSLMLFAERVYIGVVIAFVKLFCRKPEKRYKWDPIPSNVEMDWRGNWEWASTLHDGARSRFIYLCFLQIHRLLEIQNVRGIVDVLMEMLSVLGAHNYEGILRVIHDHDIGPAISYFIITFLDITHLSWYKS